MYDVEASSSVSAIPPSTSSKDKKNYGPLSQLCAAQPPPRVYIQEYSSFRSRDNVREATYVLATILFDLEKDLSMRPLEHEA